MEIPEKLNFRVDVFADDWFQRSWTRQVPFPCIYGASAKQEAIIAVSKNRKIFMGPRYNLPLSFTVISDVYSSFIPNKTTFTEYCLTQWISKLPRSFETH